MDSVILNKLYMLNGHGGPTTCQGETPMKISCDACGTTGELHASGPTRLKDAMPRHWRPRRIDGRVYNLCDICGHISHFSGGLSAYLQELLQLQPNVEFDNPEREDFSFWNPRLPDYCSVREKLKGRS